MGMHSFFGAKTANFGLGVLMVAALAACGGGGVDSSASFVVGGDVTAGTDNSTPTAKAATASTLAAASTAATSPVTFSTGFSGTDGSGAPVSVTESTQVSFTANTSSTTQPNFSITSASGTASGTTTLGSCTFTVTQSTYSASSPFAQGKTFKVDPCTVKLNTAGKTAGVSGTAQATWTFGTKTVSSTVSGVTVSSSGTVAVGSYTLPGVTVTVKPSGAGN